MVVAKASIKRRSPGRRPTLMVNTPVGDMRSYAMVMVTTPLHCTTISIWDGVEIMMRGTFANIRILNSLASKQGGFTTKFPEKIEEYTFDAAIDYQKASIPLIVFGGKVELDFSKRFPTSRLAGHLMDFLISYVWKPEKVVSMWWDELYYRIYKFQRVVKEYLEMESKGNAYYDMW